MSSESATPEAQPRRSEAQPSTFYRVTDGRIPSLGRTTINVSSPGGIVEAVFYGERHRERAEALAVELNAGSRA